MVNVHEKYFTTFDIFLGSTILTLGFRIEALNRQNKQKVEFYVLREEGLDALVQKYWARELLVEPQAFAANLKNLKNRIYSDQP